MKNDWKRIAAVAALGVSMGVAVGFTEDPAPPKQNKTERAEKDRATGAQDAADPVVDLSALDKVEEGCWSELRTRRIYFAHHEIGSEMIAGLHETMRRNPAAKLEILAYAEPDKTDEAAESVFESPAIVEAQSGRRGDPEKKIEEFSSFLRGSEGAKVDIAILKFCYGDIGRMTDTAALLERYAKAVDTIQRERPNIHIIHCTVPLKAEEHGMKGRMKRLVGAGSDASNAARSRFNEALRQRFPAAQVFDIAAIESRRPDGSFSSVEVNGKRVQTLASEYTEDGVHLNRLGRIVLARDFLVTLARQCGGGAHPIAGVEVGGANPAEPDPRE